MRRMRYQYQYNSSCSTIIISLKRKGEKREKEKKKQSRGGDDSYVLVNLLSESYTKWIAIPNYDNENF